MRDIITSARLILRPLTLNDAARVCELLCDFDVSKMISRAPFPYTIDDAHQWIGTHSAVRAGGTDFVYGITTQDDGVIGVIGLHTSNRLADLAAGAFELGYWLGQPFWGQGYATEAGRALLTAYDADLGPKPLVSGHFTENPKSGHVLEKLGFKYVGDPSTIFCVARQIEVPDRSMMREAASSPVLDMRDTITTDRLILRRMAASDIARLVTLCGDIRVAGNLSRIPHPYTRAHAQDWLEQQNQMWAESRDRVWVITLPDIGIIGTIGLHRESRLTLDNQETWEIGYWLGVPFWGQGYATEAGKAVLDELDSALGPQEVTAGYALKNPNSGHVLEKIGFQKVDAIRDLHVLATGELSSTQLMSRPAFTPAPERSPTP